MTEITHLLAPGELLSPEDIEERAAAHGMTMDAVCKLAGVDRSSFTRWKQRRYEPQLGTYRRLVFASEGRTLPRLAR